MKSKLGKTLRKIRKSKQVSINSIADEHLSKSQISRFERGESEISCIRLINILDKLHITLDEFLILHDSDNKNKVSFAHLVHYIRKEYSQQNVNNIKSLLTDSTTHHLNSFEQTMVKSIIYTLDESVSPSESDLEDLTDYLFKVENWGYYEIILLANCIRTIQYNTAFLLTKEMLKNYIYSTLNKTNKRLVTQLAINCLIVSIDKKFFQNCTFLIEEIRKLLKNELNYYEQTVFLYATGYFEFEMKNQSGVEKMQQALKVFGILGENNIKSQYQKHYNKLIKQ
ncbi:helix-turn-helix domain-containing protein [Streptococcus thermophilus]|uniref:helix-turn-helix domain-containing protein n=1 Tax=Streptococcus thermophilus TaxID=1308 RepID=UPI000BC2DD12|nr:Rgg/GadR/MutR family transcriptional regulator [Streptococcus thermophilus]ATH74727.1 MutR family transcriptional regulator [Streptococcus thermophilus]MCE2120197.1 helix-turn-helix domain-containing protein [Streptococcus thermophilus]MCE2156715.1 helix-turn-helix domain-containing protein [Streptococcus thermophilus]MCE2300241.1 helix-turn-helix domain-containing protein [Streptococcus thermophilus]MCE2302581.1 helix-turn-helix domain-containing protein [Streptococcus thermophilus]